MWKKLFKEKKKRCEDRMRNGSGERAHFKKKKKERKKVKCPSQSKTPCFGLRRNGKAGVVWFLVVLRPF